MNPDDAGHTLSPWNLCGLRDISVIKEGELFDP